MLQARVQRLASELQGTNVRAELLSAKGAMYDKLHEQAEQMRQENQRLQVSVFGDSDFVWLWSSGFGIPLVLYWCWVCRCACLYGSS